MSIQELDNLLKNEKENIITFRKTMKASKDLPKISASRGISLFYLGYILISKNRNIKLINDYLKSMNIYEKNEERRDNLARELLDIINKIMILSKKK